MTEYIKMKRKVAFIITKWTDFVLYNGRIENLGVDDERKFSDTLETTSLSYNEKYQLKQMLRSGIENI